MIIKKIWVNNINSFRAEQSAELPNGIVGIVGPNGAGKTTFVETITGALYGEMPFRKGKVLNRIHKGEQNGEMGIEFQYRECDYRVERKVTRKSQKAFLYVKAGGEWQPLVSKGGAKPFAAKIKDLIGPYETMVSSVFCSQNNANDLLSVDASERKRVFRDLLGIGGLEKKSEACGAMKVALRGQMEAAEVEYAKMKEETDKKDSLVEQLKNSNDALAKMEGELRAKQRVLEALQVEKGRITALLNEGDEATRRMEKAQRHAASASAETAVISNKIKKADEMLKNRPEIEKKARKYMELEKRYGEILKKEKEKNDLRNKLTSAKAVLISEKSKLGRELMSLIERKKRADREAAILGQVNCEREDCLFIKDALQAKKSAPELQLKIDAKESEVEAFKESSPETEEMQKCLASMKTEDPSELESQMSDLRDAYQSLSSFKGIEERRAEYGNDLEKAKKRFEAEEKERIWASGKIIEIEKSLKQRDINGEIELVNEKTSALVNEKNEYERQAGYLEGQIEAIKRIEGKLPGAKDEADEYRDGFEDYSLLEIAYGKDGIQALLIDRAIPEFNGYANEMLMLATAGAWRIEFRTQKALKTSDELRETLDIMLLGENGAMDINECSGGERQLLSIIIRAAIGIYNSISSGRQIKFFVMDEPFKNLDPENQLKMVQLIGFLKKYFRQIIITSNLFDIVRDLPSLIKVEKKVDGSKIERIR